MKSRLDDGKIPLSDKVTVITLPSWLSCELAGLQKTNELKQGNHTECKNKIQLKFTPYWKTYKDTSIKV